MNGCILCKYLHCHALSSPAAERQRVGVLQFTSICESQSQVTGLGAIAQIWS